MLSKSIPCSVYRGGTSRGIFFKEEDLPTSTEVRERIFIQAIGSSDSSQVDGLGGRSSHTNKVAIIGQSTKEGVDVDYTFVQLSPHNNQIDYSGTCGNLMSAVGAYAVDEGMVETKKTLTEVTVFNTNIDKYLEIEVPTTRDGKYNSDGEFYIAGLNNPGAKIVTKILSPGGTLTDSLFPSGEKSIIQDGSKKYEVSFVDLANPFIYIKAKDIGLSGSESIDSISSNLEMMDTLERIRKVAAIEFGLASNIDNVSLAIPKIAIVSEPQEYLTANNKVITQNQVDIVTKMLSVGKVHHSFAVSGLMNVAAATLLENTIVNEVSRNKEDIELENDTFIVKVGHANGVSEVKISLDSNNNDIKYAALDRHARRIIKGELYLSNWVL